VSIAAAAATTAHIHLSAEAAAVYIPLSAAAAAYSPRSVAYQTLYGTVKGIEFQQGLPDLDNLDPREKHLIILDDLMDEADQRVASLFTKKSHLMTRHTLSVLHRER
jgi:hypothetical protein